MRFSLRQIEYFIATAECGSITLASERINISQPSISTAISQLEAELGAQLFLRRHAQGLSLTPVGREMLVEAKKLLDNAQRLYLTVSEAMGTVQGNLSLGCLVTFAPMVLPQVSRSFMANYPNSRILPEVTDHETLLRKIERAELDVALTYDLQVPDAFTFTPLAELPPYAMVALTDPLAGQSAVLLEELAERNLILLDLPLSRDYFLGLFAQVGLVPKIAGRLHHQDVIRSMVANRMGYTIANIRPRSSDALDGSPVHKLRIAGDQLPMRLGLLRSASHEPTRLVSAFVDHCTDMISNNYIPGMEPPFMASRRVG
ncbi:UNVERIFIED_ORG: DNA-binding transcriptional LysR family regulator [Martelella mediterranea]